MCAIRKTSVLEDLKENWPGREGHKRYSLESNG